MDEGLEKRAAGGKAVYVERLWLDDLFPKAEGSVRRNSSTTVYKKIFEVNRFNERGEKSERVTKVIAHFHKPIPSVLAPMYGRHSA